MLKAGIYIADRYEIVGKAGAGGMADVYKAKDHTLGRFVGIKVLKQEFSEDINFVTKFRTEAQSAAGLEHPNIVNIYDVGSENSMHYIVMEYVEGITLKTYIEKKGQLSFKEAVSIAIQVGRGIEAAHNKHIIHRDIKPQNIIISTEGKVKVTDFGIARAASSNTINSEVMGSVHYASPEQARNGFVDGKSDIYSLGIVMYEMVTGRVPFDGESTVAIAIQHLQEEMVNPSSYAPDLPISLEKIILKCTQKSPDRRYDSISDLLLDLKKALISPDEDFVVMVPVGQQEKTRVMKREEVESIKEQTRNIYYEEAAQDTDEDEEDEDEEDDEDDDGFLNPKMEKAVTIMGIVAAVIIVVIIIYIGGSFLGLFRFGGGKGTQDKKPDKVQTEEEDNQPEEEDNNSQEDEDTVDMIDLRGKTFQEAMDALKPIGLGIEKAGEESSDQYQPGQIVTQSQEAGTKVKKHTTIRVTISSGTGEFEVPSLKDLDKDSAEAKLREYELTPDVQFEYSDTVTNGTVMSQSPEAGAKVKKGDTVTVVVSRGPQPITMPDVRSKPEAAAREELAALSINVTTNSDYNDEVPEGNVISQSILPGKTVEKGTTVTLTISMGRKNVYYSLDNYTVERLAKIPEDAVSIEAVITLYKDGGAEKINSWTVTSFPYTINQSGIEDCAQGSIRIEWTWIYLSEDGVEITDRDTTEVPKVSFTQN